MAQACSGTLLQGAGSAVVHRVCTDSRQVKRGDLFVALAGEKFDAHDFLLEVVEKGAAAVLIALGKSTAAAGLPADTGVIAVADTKVALGRLAAAYRAEFRLPSVAVGGSNGKTTTKELLAAVLRQKFQTLWSEASFNNDIGVPLTLLRLEAAHGAAVFEVGTNHPGELAPLVRLVQPQLGIITNIGREHLEFFGDVAGVAQEEGTLAELLPKDGRLFLNGDNAWTPVLARRSSAPVVTVGFGTANVWRAANIRVEEEGTRFEVVAPTEAFSGEYRLRLLGRHQVPNALLALAAGAELGVTPEQARLGLAECAPAKMRLQVSCAHGVRILDDAYNANADSMLAALQTLHDLPCQGRRVAVLGDMAELGAHVADAHREVGRRSAELRLDRLIAIGRWAGETVEAARAGGLSDAVTFPDVAAAVGAWPGLIQAGDVVLLKASRAAGFERVSEVLRRG